MFYYVYILECLSKTRKPIFYIGSCDNLRKRLLKHQKKEVASTKKYSKISLMYYEACKNKTDAKKRELQLKTGFGRGYIKRRNENYLKSRD